MWMINFNAKDSWWTLKPQQLCSLLLALVFDSNHVCPAHQGWLHTPTSQSFGYSSQANTYYLTDVLLWGLLAATPLPKVGTVATTPFGNALQVLTIVVDRHNSCNYLLATTSRMLRDALHLEAGFSCHRPSLLTYMHDGMGYLLWAFWTTLSSLSEIFLCISVNCLYSRKVWRMSATGYGFL